jgi:hypothetical protein
MPYFASIDYGVLGRACIVGKLEDTDIRRR